MFVLVVTESVLLDCLIEKEERDFLLAELREKLIDAERSQKSAETESYRQAELLYMLLDAQTQELEQPDEQEDVGNERQEPNEVLSNGCSKPPLAREKTEEHDDEFNLSHEISNGSINGLIGPSDDMRTPSRNLQHSLDDADTDDDDDDGADIDDDLVDRNVRSSQPSTESLTVQ